MGLRFTIWLVNQVARLGEAAIMRFPLDTADD
jgi:hypothetical protein